MPLNGGRPPVGLVRPALRAIRCTVACATLASIGLLAGASLAQSGEETRAQVLFREGREAMERSELDLACARFDESHRLEGAVGPLLNLANCEEKRGRIAHALSAYQGALAILRVDQIDQRKLAEERILELEPRVPTLVLRRAAVAPAGTTATLDGARVELGDRPLPVEPGEHRVEVRAAGRRTETRTLQVVVRDRIELNLEPGKALASDPGPAPVPPDEGAGPDPLLVGGLVAGGVGVAGLGVFAVTGLIALDAASTLDASCGPEHRCPADDTEGHAAADTGEAMLVPNAVGLAVGLVGIGVGAALLLLRGGDDTTAIHLGPSGGGFSARF